MAQQALTSPIELTTGANIITINYEGAGAVNLTLTNGTYGSVLTLLYELNDVLSTEDADLYACLTTDYKVEIGGGVASSLVLTWNDATFMKLMGHRLNFDCTGSTTGTDTIGKTWIPPYYSADTGRLSDDTAIAGANAIDGSFSGIALAPGNYNRRYQWKAVASVDVYKAACVQSFNFPFPAGALHYPEEERCLEEFTLNALTASPTGTEGLSIKGCYYIEDLDKYVGDGNLPATMDGGGHRLRLTTAPDNYVFCHLKPSRWTEPTTTVPNLNSLYSVGVELITSVDGCPTWSAP